MTQHTPTTNALQYLANRPLTPASALALRLVVRLVKWQECHRTRQNLARLDDHILKDIGLTRAQADAEAARPFWDGPAWWR